MNATGRTVLCRMTSTLLLISMLPVGVGQAQQSLTSFDVPGAVVTRPVGIFPGGNIVGLYVTADVGPTDFF
jgi:hypothetical protein